DLPAQVRVDRQPGARSAGLVRTSRESESEEVTRPAPDVLALVPADLAGLAATARRVETAARARSAQALNRAADARSLAQERRQVDRPQNGRTTRRPAPRRRSRRRSRPRRNATRSHSTWSTSGV